MGEGTGIVGEWRGRGGGGGCLKCIPSPRVFNDVAPIQRFTNGKAMPSPRVFNDVAPIPRFTMV